jgi:membrane protease subunit HflC
LKGNDTRFLLKPDSDFFRYFGNPNGSTPPAQPSAAAPKP